MSQAYLWLERTLIVQQPPIDLGLVADPRAFLNTLGYTPGPTPGTIAPTYPPGLPLLMAGFLAVFGTWGPLLVVPASAALLVVATYALGRRLQSAPVGLAAAAFVAFSPVVIFKSLWPMSDVPAAAAWTLCLATALGTGRGAPLTAGALAGLAILIRPNLAPLAIFGAMLLWQRDRSVPRGWMARLGLYALAAAPFLSLVGWFNDHLYGSPFSSGYGDVRALYSWGFIRPNLENYASWFLTSQGPFLAVLALYGWARAFTDRSLRPLAFFTAAVVAAYLPYLVFDDWIWLRFLLPAYPALLVVTAAAAAALLGRLTPWLRRSLTVAGLALVIGHSVWFTTSKEPFDLHAGEQRYAAIGGHVRAALPANAAFLTMQHSGSLRYYSGRLTARYDWLSAGHLALGRAALEEAGYEVYVLVDEWEEADLRKRFTAPGEAAFLDAPPLIELVSSMRVRVYRLSDHEDPTAPATTYIASGRGIPIPPVRRQAIAWEPLTHRTN
ncbi:MAG TPA: glycosyltransferase family 39 protein [Planctomycetaceae bacterium]|nr:glycosyltransferase family 39 protein [Planctomycetaceae bacterium]